MLSTYGERLSATRKAKNITLAELSEKVGVTSASLSRAENGVIMPRKTTRKAIAQALGVTEEWLETGTGEMEEAPKHIEEEFDASLIPEPLRVRLQDALAFMTDQQIETAVLVCEAMAEVNRHQRLKEYYKMIAQSDQAQTVDIRKYANQTAPGKIVKDGGHIYAGFDVLGTLEREENGKNES